MSRMSSLSERSKGGWWCLVFQVTTLTRGHVAGTDMIRLLGVMYYPYKGEKNSCNQHPCFFMITCVWLAQKWVFPIVAVREHIQQVGWLVACFRLPWLISHLNPQHPIPFPCHFLLSVSTSLAHDHSSSINEAPQLHPAAALYLLLLFWQHFFWALNFSTNESASNSLCWSHMQFVQSGLWQRTPACSYLILWGEAPSY